MRFLRKFLVVLALAVAVSPALAKEAKKVGAGKSQYKSVTVNINKANAPALSAYLMGIGPTRAKAIVSYRSKKGKFSATKDLMEVEGIGEKVYAGLKKNISTSRGETSPPKGYKMGAASKTGAKKKTGSALNRKKAGDKKLGAAKAKAGDKKAKVAKKPTKLKAKKKIKKPVSKLKAKKKPVKKAKKKVKTK